MRQACDLICEHCRACAQAQPNPDELTTAEAQRMVDQLCEFPHPPMLVFTGGDPLKRADIYTLVEYATQRGLITSVTPAATSLATEAALRRLKNAGVARLALSLDGADHETHDKFRGVPGSFQRTLDILATARSLGMPIQVNTTITPNNYRQVDQMAELMAELQVVMWSVFFLVPVGRATYMGRITPEQYEWVFERLWWNSKRHAFAIKSTEAPHYRRFVRLSQRSRKAETNRAASPFSSLGINDGKGVMFIGHTGEIYPSGFMPIYCGQLSLHHVVEVYQRSPLMRALRDTSRLEGKCGRCEFRKICGGSRARSYAVTGNVFAEEPDCIYQPAEKDLKSVGLRTPAWRLVYKTEFDPYLFEKD